MTDEELNAIVANAYRAVEHRPIIPNPAEGIEPVETEPSTPSVPETPVVETTPSAEDIDAIIQQQQNNAVVEEEPYNENQGEGRDLDAEEDHDWEQALNGGIMQPTIGVDVAAETPATPAEAVMEAPQPPQESQEQPAAEQPVDDDIHIENSETVFQDESDARFQGAPWYETVHDQSITLIGLGGIGSHTCFQLARMKPNVLYLYDPDRVERVNMSGQLYNSNDEGNFKTDSCINFVNLYASYYDTVSFVNRFDESCEASDIMICGLDNMEARKIVFNKWLQHVKELPESERYKCLFIDGRMSAENIQVFAMTGNDSYYIDTYLREWLFSDSEADATVCSYKQTSFCAAMIGGLISNLFVNFCANLAGGYRRLPFMTEYSAETMMLKTTV